MNETKRTTQAVQNDVSKESVVTNQVIDYTSNITRVVQQVRSKIVNVSSYAQDGQKIRTISGFVYSSNEESCEIISNYRILTDAYQVMIQFDNGIEIEAEVVGYDELSDVAVFRTHPNFEVEPIKFTDNEVIDAGEFAFVIGGRRSETAERTISYGVVSSQLSFNKVSADNKSSWIVRTFESDVTLNQTNVGSPLLNLNGEVIGMLSQSLTSTVAAGMSYSVSGNEIRYIAEQLKQNGSLNRGYLGAICRDIDQMESYEKVALGIGLDNIYGVLCTSIVADSPAKEAGLLPQDIILRIDRWEIANDQDLLGALYSFHAGDEVEIGIIRNNEAQTLKVVLK